MNKAFALGAAMLCACAPDQSLLVLRVDQDIAVIAHPATLERPEDGQCSTGSLTIIGPAVLTAATWWPAEGSVEAVQFPDLDALEFPDEATVHFDYCPRQDERSAGEIWMTFSEAPALTLWMEER